MKSVVLCGSIRFKDGMLTFADELERLGATIYIPDFYSLDEDWDNLTEVQRKHAALALTHEHFYKMRMADVVFIYNEGGYLGNSTTMEVGYAVALGKPIYMLAEDEDEICRSVLCRGLHATPKELFDRLQ